MKIKQSYHGDGGKEGYKYQLYQNNKKIGELENLPNEVHYGSTIEINDAVYFVDHIYDCEKSPEKHEVVWYILEPFKADFKLKCI